MDSYANCTVGASLLEVGDEELLIGNLKRIFCPGWIFGGHVRRTRWPLARRLKDWFGNTPGGTTTSNSCMMGGVVGAEDDDVGCCVCSGGRSRDVPWVVLRLLGGLDDVCCVGIIRKFIPACTLAGHVTTEGWMVYNF